MSKRFLIVFSLFTVFLPSLAPAQNTFWREINGLPGINELLQGANGRIIAGTRGYGIYVSDDDGASWYPSGIPGKEIHELFGNSDSMYAIASTSTSAPIVHRSTDNGRTWSAFHYLFTHYQGGDLSFMDLNGSGILTGLGRYASARGDTFYCKIFQRIDGAWRMIGDYLPISCRANVPVSTFRIDAKNNFYMVASGLYISTDLGLTWKLHFPDRTVTTLEITPSGRVVVGVSPNAATNGGVYQTDDLGTTWLQLGLTEESLVSMGVDSTGRIFVGTTDGGYRHDPATQTWLPLGVPSYIQTMTTLTFNGREVISPSGDLLVSRAGTVFIGGPDAGIYRSRDGGEKWIQTSPRRQDIVSLLSTTGALFAGSLGKGAFKSTDNGGSWNQIDPAALCGDMVYALEKSGDNIYAGTECGLARSTDRGESWENLTSGAMNALVRAIVKRRSGKGFVIATHQGVYRAPENDERQWERIGFAGKNITALAEHPGGDLVASVEGDDVYFSSDDGAHWRSAEINRGDILTLGISPEGTIFAGGYGNVFRSTDRGLSWEKVFLDGSYIYSLEFDGGGKSYAGTYNGIFVSIDQGASWQRIDMTGLRVICTLSLEYDGAGSLYAGTYRGGIFQTRKTLDVSEEYAERVNGEIPAELELLQNYPNPFNPTTNLRFTVADIRFVSLKVYNVFGEEVALLVNEMKSPGSYTVAWDATPFPSGIYFARLAAGAYSETRKLVLIR